MVINNFSKKYRFLSNFYLCTTIIDDIRWRSVEHYYQASKTNDISKKMLILFAAKPGEAKRIGKNVELIPEWESVKQSIMKKGLEAKFNQNLGLQAQLIKTDGMILIEGNYWHDNIWGDCFCPTCSYIPGLNLLGVLLMEVRDSLL